jgi:hypothetical protein
MLIKPNIPNKPLDKKECYLGNALLKRSGVKTVHTPEMIQELARCEEDIVYFIESYCRIISLDDGEIPFVMHGYQKKMVVQMLENRFTLFMLPRQMGKSQTTAAYILHQVIFNSHYTVAILANKDSASREILDRVQFMYTLLPSWMQLGVVTWNKGDIELDNHSKIFTAATSPSAIRGKSVNLLYCVPGETKVTFSDDTDAVYHARIDTLPGPGTVDYEHKPQHGRQYAYHTVYKTTNTINGKVYVGVHSTDDLGDGYLGSGKVLMASIEKNGVAAFTKEYIAIFDNRAAAMALEAAIVDEEFVGRDDTYNLALGGIGGIPQPPRGPAHHMWGVPKSDEHRAKISAAHVGKKCPSNLITNLDPVKIEKTRQAHLGSKRSDDSRKRMSEARKASIAKSGGAVVGKGAKYFHDPATFSYARFASDEEVPSGWVAGSGRAWFNDGVSEKFTSPVDRPDGWMAGRLK